MSNRQLFLARAHNAGWEERRVQAYLYANEQNGLPFPSSNWSASDLERASQHSLELYEQGLSKREETKADDDGQWERDHPIAMFMSSTIGITFGILAGVIIGLFNAFTGDDK